MSQLKSAFSLSRHKAVKGMQHKAVEIFVSQNDIFEANAKYPKEAFPKGAHWEYIRDEFRKKHGVEILDTEKLVIYTTVLDDTMKIVGHKGYSVSEPKV